MTIATTTNRVDVLGNGSATVFSFAPVVIFEASDLQVTLRDSAGNETPLTQGAGSANYSVGVTSYPGVGSVTFPASGGTPIPTGSTLTIKRIVPLVQSVSLENQGAYLPSVQEGEFDYLTAIDQQQQEQLNRTLQLPQTDPAAPLTIPPSAIRANMLLGFDSAGLPAVFTGLNTGAAVSSAMIPVVEASSIQSALNAIGTARIVTAQQFGAIGDGVADDAAAIQNAINALNPGGVVALQPGTYRIATPIKMRPNVSLLGCQGVTIRQGNAANLSPMIDFNTFGATNASVRGVTIDGNSAHNTNSDFTFMVTSAQGGTIIRDCSLVNCPGHCVVISGVAGGNEVVGNLFNGVFGHALQVVGPALFSAVQTFVANNKFFNVGFFCISGVLADEVTVINNTVFSVRVVCHVSTLGTAVTWVSGATFASLSNGMVIRIAGVEHQIQSVNSTESLTIMETAGTSTNQPAVAGGGDIINFDTCRNLIVANNTLSDGMSIGIVLHNSVGGGTISGCVISGNVVQFCGNTGICVAATTSSIIQAVNISGNVVYACGAGTANVANTNDGIYLVGSTLRSISVVGNSSQDLDGGTQEWGLYIDASVPSGQVVSSGNTLAGTVGNAFGAGWITYSPSLTALSGAFTAASVAGRYTISDKTVTFEVTVTITTNGSAAAGVQIGLPTLPGIGTYVVVGRASAVSGKALVGTINSATNFVIVQNYDNSYPGSSGETLVISGSYEAQ